MQNTNTAAPTFKHIKVAQVTPIIGGKLEGIHLCDLTEEVKEEIRQALWHYGVLFANNQNLSPQQQKDLAYVFADQLEHHSFAPNLGDEGHPEVMKIEMAKNSNASSTTDIWHQDVTGRQYPNFVNVLQAKEVPFGADTMWASATAGYERLPFALKQLFLNLDVDHDTLYGILRHDFGNVKAITKQILELDEVNTYPAVINHPITGKLSLFIGSAWTKRIHKYPAELSERILSIAFNIPKTPEIQVRHQWQAGDIAIWDNFATWHYGVTSDLRGQNRLLHRVGAWSTNIMPSLNREKALNDLMNAK